MKAARAIVSTTSGNAGRLLRDWQREARFHSRFAITEGMFRHGVPAAAPEFS